MQMIYKEGSKLCFSDHRRNQTGEEQHLCCLPECISHRSITKENVGQGCTLSCSAPLHVPFALSSVAVDALIQLK